MGYNNKTTQQPTGESKLCQLIYSEEEEGWYWQQTFGAWQVTWLYDTIEDAITAMNENKLEWIKVKK